MTNILQMGRFNHHLGNRFCLGGLAAGNIHIPRLGVFSKGQEAKKALQAGQQILRDLEDQVDLGLRTVRVPLIDATLHETNTTLEHQWLVHMNFISGWPIFRCYVTSRECMFFCNKDDMSILYIKSSPQRMVLLLFKEKNWQCSHDM